MQELAATLKAKLEEASKIETAKPVKPGAEDKGDAEAVILTRQDRYGNIRPIHKREHDSDKKKRRLKKQKVSSVID